MLANLHEVNSAFELDDQCRTELSWHPLASHPYHGAATDNGPTPQRRS